MVQYASARKRSLMKYIPEQGDIVWINFDPSAGKEITKRRPAFVISRKSFNQHTEMSIVAPITNQIKGMKLEIVLPEKMNTAGAILVHQLKSIDYKNREIIFIETAPQAIIEQVISFAQLIIK
jgi:mRNA-degrading endonuclease toxin of MazEF toxin-antitoxin module